MITTMINTYILLFPDWNEHPQASRGISWGSSESSPAQAGGFRTRLSTSPWQRTTKSPSHFKMRVQSVLGLQGGISCPTQISLWVLWVCLWLFHLRWEEIKTCGAYREAPGSVVSYTTMNTVWLYLHVTSVKCFNDFNKCHLNFMQLFFLFLSILVELWHTDKKTAF